MTFIVHGLSEKDKAQIWAVSPAQAGPKCSPADVCLHVKGILERMAEGLLTVPIKECEAISNFRCLAKAERDQFLMPQA